jgi:hypothetical protein
MVFKSHQQSYLPAPELPAPTPPPPEIPGPELPAPWPPDGPGAAMPVDGPGRGTAGAGAGMPPDVATPPAPGDNVVNAISGPVIVPNGSEDDDSDGVASRNGGLSCSFSSSADKAIASGMSNNDDLQ